MNLETLLFERKGRVGVITLNRPERLNAINAKMLSELSSLLSSIEEDPEVRVVIVTGAGRAFSSGFDLKEQMERRPSGVKVWREILQKDFDVVMRFWRLSKPTIAAVNGHCLAGAFELALACDMTIAVEHAVFGEPELKFGAGIVVLLLPWLVGPKKAKEIILSGLDDLSAPAALEAGIVNDVVPAGHLMTKAFDIANRISAVDPSLVRQTKRTINRTFEIMGLEEALQAALDVDLHIEGEGSPDKQQFMELARAEGLRAAIEWRDARFRSEGESR